MAGYVSEKQRNGYTVNPKVYVDELSRFSQVLESFVYPALGASAPGTVPEMQKGFRWFRYSLRALIGLTAAEKDLWPLSQEGGVDWMLEESAAASSVRPRSTVHFAISRTVFALYMSMMAMAVVQVPETYEALSTAFKLRGEFSQVVQEFQAGYEFDSLKVRASLIESYEGKIAQLENQLVAADSATADEMRLKIERYQKIIRSIEVELESFK